MNFQYSNHNYGAVLQAAALEFGIKNLGYSVEHIDFIPKKVPLSLLLRVRGIIGRLLRYVGLIKTKKLRPDMENSSVFEDFRCQYIKRTLTKYHSIEELKQLDNTYYSVVVGSDQVWRPTMTGSNADAYFLSFAGEECKKISYAASFGVDNWEIDEDNSLTKNIKNQIRRFSHVSVREDSGVKICENIFDIQAKHVLDPTLLVGRQFFDNIIDGHQKGNIASEIVFYKLDVDDYFLSQLEFLGRGLNFSIENIYYKEENGKYFYNTVPKWLTNIRESKLVITDSFHCICFAILFQKPFVYYPNEGRGMSRLESLLGKLGLLSRICRDVNMLSDEKFVLAEINYVDVNERLAKLRETSHDFLSFSLKN